MVHALAVLLVFQCLGEVTAYGLRLPVPGPVIGMALLLGGLLFDPARLAPLRETSLGLLRHLSLLFVPAGDGVMLHAGRLADVQVSPEMGAFAGLAMGLAALLTAVVVPLLVRLAG